MNCKNKKTSLIFASIIAALLIAFTAVLPSVADSLKLSNSSNGSEIDVEATKTAEWIDDDYKAGKVKITANATGKDETTPNVLFVGTLCGAHDLSVHTIEGALDSITETSNVDYFFFNNAEDDIKSVDDFSNSLAKGEKFASKWPSKLETIYKAETWNEEEQKWNTSLVTRNHQALKKFLDCIYSQIIVNKKSYDFIVLEFDQTRISDWYRNLPPDNDPSGTIPKGDYTKFSHENDVANLMKDFYINNQVIWVTDSKVTEGETSSLYKPNRRMNVRTYDLETRIINYNSLKALLVPSLFKDTSDSPSSTDEQLRAIEKNLSGDPVDDKYVLGFDRQIGYGNSNKIGQFLKDAIESLYEYQIVIEDKIDMSDNIKITQDKVSFEIWDAESTKWIPVPELLKPVINVNYATGEVSASVANLKGNNKFRLTILFEDKSSTERFIDKSKDGDPNDGPADVSVVPGAGETKVDEPETESPLDWKIPIYYKVEEDYEGTPGIEVDNPQDNISTSAESKPGGSTASETANIKFQYWSTEIDGKDTFVSADFKFVPEPDKTTNRYVTRTYIAHYAESPAETKRLTVTKVWSDGDDFHLNDKITIHMFADELELGTFVMDSSIKWSYTTKYEYQIYNDATLEPIKYSFKEDTVDGYTTTYVVEEGDPKTSGNTVITNTLVPGPGPQPTPDPTPDPGVVTPDGHSPVKTSDFTDFMALIVVAGVALSFVLIISRVKARKNKERG